MSIIIWPNHQKLKIGVNVLTTICLIYSALKTGVYFTERGLEKKIIKFIMYLGLYNSIMNLYSWFITTGGTVGRYNFYSIINESVSSNIGLSVLGSLLFLSTDNLKKRLKYFGFIICASNVLIIITREKQVLFLCYMLVYVWALNNNDKRINRKLFRVMLLVFFIVLVYLIFYETVQTSLNTYSSLLDLSQLDNVERNLAVRDSVNMLKTSRGIGVGYGNYSLFSEFTTLATPHSGFYSILSELGFIGLLIVGICFFHILRVCFFMLLKNSEKIYYSLSIYLIFSIILFIISNTNFFPPPNERAYYLECVICWLFVGILDVLYKGRKLSTLKHKKDK